jgi:hypothetical protein
MKLYKIGFLRDGKLTYIIEEARTEKSALIKAEQDGYELDYFYEIVKI